MRRASSARSTALHRFKALSDQARASTMYVLATAAAREASNGPDFIHQAEIDPAAARCACSPARKRRNFSALGIVSGYFEPDGIAGDLGGGSLELIDIKGKEIGKGITLPLGGLRLSEYADGSLAKARSFARKHVKTAQIAQQGRGTHLLCGRRHLAKSSPSCTWRSATIRCI